LLSSSIHSISVCLFFFSCSRSHRALHSFPTRRSSDLASVLSCCSRAAIFSGNSFSSFSSHGASLRGLRWFLRSLELGSEPVFVAAAGWLLLGSLCLFLFCDVGFCGRGASACTLFASRRCSSQSS